MVVTPAQGRGVVTRLLPMGDTAILVETNDIDAVLALSAALDQQMLSRQGVWADVEDIVTAARSVLVVARAGACLLYTSPDGFLSLFSARLQCHYHLSYFFPEERSAGDWQSFC